MGRQILMGWMCVLGCLGWASGTTYYVDGRAAGANNGSSWTDAFTDLQIALDAAVKGDEVRVGQGTYKPTVPGGDRAISFVIPDGVTLLGGYAGVGANDPDHCDIEAYLTVLSGDLNGDDAAVEVPEKLLDEPTRQDNSYHVVRMNHVYPPAPTTISGFTVMGGNANGSHYSQQGGGGVSVDRYSVFIQNCVITANSALYQGGGCSGGNLADCRIAVNFAGQTGGGVFSPQSMQVCVIEGNLSDMGGGMYGAYSDTVYFLCEFRDNKAGLGGAVFIGNIAGNFESSAFVGNRASDNGGGIYIFNNCTCQSELMMFRCRMIGNRSDGNGGAIYHEGNPRVVLYSCLIQNNQAALDGGGIFSLTYKGMRDMGYLGVTNCAIVGNSAGQQAGGVWFCSMTTEFLDVVNTILWGNGDLQGLGKQDGQIRIGLGCSQEDPQATPSAAVAPSSVRYCCIEGLMGSFGGEGNIGKDPLFVPSMGPLPNYHLATESPCINAGTNAAYPCVVGQPNSATGTVVDPTDPTCSAGLTDLDGLPRIRGGIVDMGAYEFQTLPGVILYVDDSAPGLQDGSSWGDAFTKLQDALAAAHAGQEIRAGQGIYRPADPNGSREASFILKGGVAVRGGYAGFRAVNPDERDIRRYETILSGDLNDNDWGGWFNSSRMDNCFNVVMAYGPLSGAALEGFTVTGGHGGLSGGGLYCHTAVGVEVRDCVFHGNSAELGGGMCDFWSSSSQVTNCVFTDNYSTRGGAVYLNGEFCMTLDHCLIYGNRAEWGGGIYLDEAYTSIVNCTIANNQARDQWGGVIDNPGTSHFGSCIFWGNTCADGSVEWAQIGRKGDDSQFDYCCVQGWTGQFSGVGTIDADPLFADAAIGDYHLKSQTGRWDPIAKAWVQDTVTSPCIDAGDPAEPIMYEPFPNGGVINMGVYGGTAEASKSWFGGPVCEVIAAGDINGDCKVDLGDFAILARHWLETN